MISYSPLAGGWPSGRYRKDTEVTGPTSPACQRPVNRFDMSLEANQRKFAAAENLPQLAEEAGMTLVGGLITIPASEPATTNAPIRGARATMIPAAISIAPTTYMKSWPVESGWILLIQLAR